DLPIQVTNPVDLIAPVVSTEIVVISILDCGKAAGEWVGREQVAVEIKFLSALAGHDGYVNPFIGLEHIRRHKLLVDSSWIPKLETHCSRVLELIKIHRLPGLAEVKQSGVPAKPAPFDPALDSGFGEFVN